MPREAFIEGIANSLDKQVFFAARTGVPGISAGEEACGLGEESWLVLSASESSSCSVCGIAVLRSWCWSLEIKTTAV